MLLSILDHLLGFLVFMNVACVLVCLAGWIGGISETPKKKRKKRKKKRKCWPYDSGSVSRNEE